MNKRLFSSQMIQEAGQVIREREGAAICFGLEDRLVPKICKLVTDHVYIRTQTSNQVLR